MPNNNADLFKQLAVNLGVPLSALDPLAEIINGPLRKNDLSDDITDDNHLDTLGVTEEESP